MSTVVAIAAALASLSFQEAPEGHWMSADGHIGAVAFPGGVFVGWWDAAWAGPASPVSVLRGVRHLPAAFLDQQGAELADAIADARVDRAAAVQVCLRCGVACLPGQMHDQRLCHGCAERELGVVH